MFPISGKLDNTAIDALKPRLENVSILDLLASSGWFVLLAHSPSKYTLVLEK